MVRDPLREMPALTVPLIRSFLRPGGAPLRERIAGLKIVMGAMRQTQRDPRRNPDNDPLRRVRAALAADAQRLQALEEQAQGEIRRAFASASVETPS
jgi:hypothetical protein